MASLINLAYAFAKSALKQNWKEVPGKASNPLIIEAYKAVDGLNNPEMIDDGEVPWCSCWVNWCVQKAGGRGTRSAMARSWLRWGKKSTGKVGDIVVLRRGTSSVTGHVGFVHKMGTLYVEVLGGNQSNDVNVKKYLRALVIDYRTSLDT